MHQCCLGSSSSSPGPQLLWGQPASTTISISIFITILIFILIFIFILLLPPVLPPSTRRWWGCTGGSRRILPSLTVPAVSCSCPFVH